MHDAQIRLRIRIGSHHSRCPMIRMWSGPSEPSWEESPKFVGGLRIASLGARFLDRSLGSHIKVLSFWSPSYSLHGIYDVASMVWHFVLCGPLSPSRRYFLSNVGALITCPIHHYQQQCAHFFFFTVGIRTDVPASIESWDNKGNSGSKGRKAYRAPIYVVVPDDGGPDFHELRSLSRDFTMSKV